MEYRISQPISNVDPVFIVTINTFQASNREISVTLDFLPSDYERFVRALQSELEDFWREQDETILEDAGIGSPRPRDVELEQPSRSDVVSPSQHSSSQDERKNEQTK